MPCARCAGSHAQLLTAAVRSRALQTWDQLERWLPPMDPLLATSNAQDRLVEVVEQWMALPNLFHVSSPKRPLACFARTYAEARSSARVATGHERAVRGHAARGSLEGGVATRPQVRRGRGPAAARVRRARGTVLVHAAAASDPTAWFLPLTPPTHTDTPPPLSCDV